MRSEATPEPRLYAVAWRRHEAVRVRARTAGAARYRLFRQLCELGFLRSADFPEYLLEVRAHRLRAGAPHAGMG